MSENEDQLPNIWKLSHGWNLEEHLDWLAHNQYLTIGWGEDKKQGKSFREKLKKGDIVSLSERRGYAKCYALVRVTGDVISDETSPLKTGWILRKYEIIKKSIDFDKKYEGDPKGWAPTMNGTFFEVPRRELHLFETNILKPHYGIDLNQLKALWNKTKGREEIQEQSLTSLEARSPEAQHSPLNQIFYGPPGTGKTYQTITEAVKICDPDFYSKHKEDRQELKKRYDELVSENRVRFVTFHQSYGYEEFIEGLKAETTEERNISYEIKDGIFKEICLEALASPEEIPSFSERSERKKYVLIIDEINRGNISKIFGELITLIEPSKRTGEPEALRLTLPYSGHEFSVPNNVYLIGTMNTADRSLAMIDTALRRRFEFVEMLPDSGCLSGKIIDGIDLKQLLETLNKRIEMLYDREHMLGHAFFMSVEDKAGLKAVFQNKIIPLLQEYFFEDWEKIRLVLADNQKKEELQFILEVQRDTNLLGQVDWSEYGLEEKNYRIVPANKGVWEKPEAYKAIYDPKIVENSEEGNASAEKQP